MLFVVIYGAMSTKLQAVGCYYVVTILAVMVVNGALMLASPRTWARLPRWLRAEGLPGERIPPAWAAIQIQATGATILAAIGWVLYETLLSGG
jgi:uncharacterized membrane protein